MARSSKANKRKTPRTQRARASTTRGKSTAALRAQLKASLSNGSDRDELVALFDQLAAERDAVATERDTEAAKREELTKANGELTKANGELTKANGELTKANGELTKANGELTTTADKLRQQVQHLSRLLFGRRSEKLRPDELGQLALAFGADEAQANAADPEVPTPDAPDEEADSATAGEQKSERERKEKKRNHPGRTKLSPELERQVTDVAVPEDERACKCCGAEMQCIGHLEHERVEYVPAKLVVHVERREKLGCKACRDDAVTAERADPSGGRRRAGHSLLAHLVEDKCDDALPIHRQRDRLLRLGFEVPPNTLYGYWAYVTDLLWPVADTTLSVVLGDPHYVALDDTTLRVLDKNKRAGIYKGHLWCFTGSGPLVAYAFTETWKAQQVVPWVAAIESFIQCDDYGGYSSTVHWPGGGQRILVPPERRLGCMMHVRRRFHKALKGSDRRAQKPIELIRSLYKVEAEAKAQGLDAQARTLLRAERSLPTLDEFDQWVDQNKPLVLPSSPLGRAIGYAEQQRPFIRRCFEDGRFEIDNGHTERQIREPAIGRKNFLFTGSADGAKRLAGAYTLVQSCRSVGIPVRAYLLDVIGKLEAGWPLRRIRELVPDRWAVLHRPAATDQLA